MENHIGCQDLDLGQPCERQVPYHCTIVQDNQVTSKVDFKVDRFYLGEYLNDPVESLTTDFLVTTMLSRSSD